MGQNKPIKVLLIEDDKDSALIVETQLKLSQSPDCKFELHHAESLKSGLALLIPQDFDALLLDLSLPDSNGIETVLRVLTAGVNIPIIVLTALTDQKTATEAVSLGAQDYLVKGEINGRLLERAIRYAIERKKLVRQLEGIIRGSVDGMVVVDSAWIVKYMNPAAEHILEKASSELLGQAFPCPVTPQKPAMWKIPSTTGEERVMEIRSTEIAWAQNPALLMCIRDVTELQHVEQLRGEIRERAHVEHLKDEILDIISHELYGPFDVAEDALAQLTEGIAADPLPERHARIIGLIHQNLKRLNKWMNNLMDLSRFELGKVPVQRQALNLPPLIREVAQVFHSHAQSKNIAFQIDIPENMPKIYADIEMITKLLKHLIDNAMRFAMSAVTVRVRLTGDGIQISVIDDGPPIPVEKLGDVFSKFVQVRRSAAGVTCEGMGLWPAICKEIMALHQGRIWVASTMAGEVQFHCILPEYLPQETASGVETITTAAS